jgi:uncharacterized Ntn-hydrolase superfamily protein
VTFSIVARSADGSAVGVAVASKFLAVGAAVPAAASGVGALATQAMANLGYGPQGLALLAGGMAPADVLASLTAADGERDHRQAGLVDAQGRSATYTGASCLPWAGGACGEGYAVQGNILAGPEVVDAMVATWLAGDPALELADRMLAALLAGDRAGGDSRGRQSAAVLVVSPAGGYGGGSDVAVDLRVDDHVDPVPELVRLRALHVVLFGRTPADQCLPLTGDHAAEVAALLTATGHPADAAGVEEALVAWAGIENLEERMVPGRIDPVVLDLLRASVTR